MNPKTHKLTLRFRDGWFGFDFDVEHESRYRWWLVLVAWTNVLGNAVMPIMPGAFLIGWEIANPPVSPGHRQPAQGEG